MKSAVLLFLVLLGIYVPQAQSQDQPVDTGLGDCVDFVIYGSPTLTTQVNSTDFQFLYGPGSYLDKPGKKVYVSNYTCSPNNLAGLNYAVAQVAHEMGHLYLDQGWPLGTRADYIEKACTNEGLAVLNNVTARNEIIATSENTVDIGLAAANSTALLAVIAGGGANLAKRVGDTFCDGNVASTTGENYKIYYGKEYDTIYGPKPDPKGEE
ncbi:MULTISPECIES: hypothetical protein [unclassified Stenotrophomonas]|uniref:hypothetical protein n=1 Tax=unclassified Stenotrophomonas TaxID=196198 RepID=UPI003466B726